MPIRKDKAGRWHAEACVGRRRLHRRLPEGATASEAKRVEADLTQKLHAAQPAPVVAGDPMLTELLADYTERHAYTLRSPATARYHALRIGRWCTGRRVSETRAVVAAIVQDMTGHYKPATINKSLGTLKKALRLAYEHGLTATNHGDAIKLLPENNIRTTTLTLPQVQALADCASENVRAAIWIAVFTGCRRVEIVSIQAADIGADTITLRAGATKTERHRSIPIIAPLRPCLAYLPLKITARGIEGSFRRLSTCLGL
jgi:integrase